MSLSTHSWSDAKGSWSLAIDSADGVLGQTTNLTVSFPDGTSKTENVTVFADSDVTQAGGAKEYIMTIIIPNLISMLKAMIAAWAPVTQTPSQQVVAMLPSLVWTDSPTNPIPSLP